MTKEERKKAIENLEFSATVGIRPSKEAFKVALEALEALKQEPAREHGEWMFEYDNHIAKFYHCSVCGRKLTVLSGHDLSEFPYCHCGADMRGTKLPYADKSGLEYADQPTLRSAT